MSPIGIKIDEESLGLRGRGAVLGSIWIEISDKAFPSDDWNDFIVVVLSWWLKEVVLLKEQKPGLVHEFRFMEGPFYLHLEVEDNGKALLECRERTSKGYQTVLTERSNVEEIWNAVLSASKRVLDVVDERGWDNLETQRLKDTWNLAMSMN